MLSVGCEVQPAEGIMKRLIISLVANLAGVVALLPGLGIDAWLHAEDDETLAVREGIFTLANPGHALLALGIAMACGGIFSALNAAWGMAGGGGTFGRAWIRHAALGGSVVASVGAIAFAMAVSSSGQAHDASGGVAHSSADAAFPAVSSAMLEAARTHIGDSILPGDSAMTADAMLDGSATMGVPAASHPHEAPQATPAEVACMAQLTEDTRAATARFADYNVSVAEGYVQNPGKVGANHYPNRAYTLDGKIMELSQPETLIYRTDAAGSRTLVGVMFKAAKGQPGPAPCGAASHWHTHTNCVDPATRAQTDEAAPGICPPGYDLRESGEMIHIWFAGPGQRKSA